MCVYLRAKLQDSGVIVTGFGQGRGGRGGFYPLSPPPPPPPPPAPLKMNPLEANLD